MKTINLKKKKCDLYNGPTTEEIIILICIIYCDSSLREEVSCTFDNLYNIPIY